MNTLENLTDGELLELNSWMNSLTERERDTVINSFDTKFALHVVRLALECEQILMEHNLDIEKNSEVLKAIRRGEWTEQKLREWFDMKEKQLEELYVKSDLKYSPDEDEIKDLLLKCLEMHYGSLETAVKLEVPVERMISDLREVLDRYEKKVI